MPGRGAAKPVAKCLNRGAGSSQEHAGPAQPPEEFGTNVSHISAADAITNAAASSDGPASASATVVQLQTIFTVFDLTHVIADTSGKQAYDEQNAEHCNAKRYKVRPSPFREHRFQLESGAETACIRDMSPLGTARHNLIFGCFRTCWT